MIGDMIEGDVNGDGVSDFRILVTLNWDLQSASFIL